ncbi:hypothetical protein [Streptomyces virginiae]
MVQLCDGEGADRQAGFTKWLGAVGAEVDPGVAFKSVDANGDERLSIDELRAAEKTYDKGDVDLSRPG